ncbi:hypothetical protein [Arthrobacter sp. PM3]|uniref:hypothetical protein n=1 Tax=Arthrobacter sp. PM3 TaxID=2017685 RepID=UPI000E10BF08|nr:hypothetical protein [Arthrobacter sp. PM3]AXJ10109.1 hypothetical protein CFN17_11080 [Arthrobacter sp. PM3]
MNRALCLPNNREWTAEEFSSLAPPRRDSLKRRLVCLDCGARAIFQSAGRRRRPVFRASHRKDCAVVAPAWGVFRFLQ